MRMLPNSMSVFVLRYLAESIVDFSPALSSPGKPVFRHHTFPTSSIANASSVSSPSIAYWPRKCSVSKISFHLKLPATAPQSPIRAMTSWTLFLLSLPLPPRILPALLHRPRLRSFAFLPDPGGAPPAPRYHSSRLAALSRRAHHPRPSSSRGARPRPASHRRARPPLQFACALPATAAQSLCGSGGRQSVFSLCQF